MDVSARLDRYKFVHESGDDWVLVWVCVAVGGDMPKPITSYD